MEQNLSEEAQGLDHRGRVARVIFQDPGSPVLQGDTWTCEPSREHRFPL